MLVVFGLRANVILKGHFRWRCTRRTQVPPLLFRFSLVAIALFSMRGIGMLSVRQHYFIRVVVVFVECIFFSTLLHFFTCTSRRALSPQRYCILQVVEAVRTVLVVVIASPAFHKVSTIHAYYDYGYT